MTIIRTGQGITPPPPVRPCSGTLVVTSVAPKAPHVVARSEARLVVDSPMGKRYRITFDPADVTETVNVTELERPRPSSPQQARHERHRDEGTI